MQRTSNRKSFYNEKTGKIDIYRDTTPLFLRIHDKPLLYPRGLHKIHDQRNDETLSWIPINDLLSRTFQGYRLSRLYNLPMIDAEGKSETDMITEAPSDYVYRIKFDVLTQSLAQFIGSRHYKHDQVKTYAGPIFNYALKGSWILIVECPSPNPPLGEITDVDQETQRSIYLFIPRRHHEKTDENTITPKWSIVLEKSAHPTTGEYVRQWLEQVFDSRVTKSGSRNASKFVKEFVEEMWLYTKLKNFKIDQRPLELGFLVPEPINKHLNTIPISVPIECVQDLSVSDPKTKPNVIPAIIKTLKEKTGIPLDKIPLFRAGIGGVLVDLTLNSFKIKVYSQHTPQPKLQRKFDKNTEIEEEFRFALMCQWLESVICS